MEKTVVRKHKTHSIDQPASKVRDKPSTWCGEGGLWDMTLSLTNNVPRQGERASSEGGPVELEHVHVGCDLVEHTTSAVP